MDPHAATEIGDVLPDTLEELSRMGFIKPLYLGKRAQTTQTCPEFLG